MRSMTSAAPRSTPSSGTWISKICSPYRISTDRRTVMGPENSPRRDRPSASISAKSRRTASAPIRPTSPTCVRTSSYRKSVASIPHAESTDAARGTTMRVISSMRATSVMCRPAAPPKERSVKRRGSAPRRTDTSRMPSAMFVSTTRWMPSAASTRLVPSAVATALTA